MSTGQTNVIECWDSVNQIIAVSHNKLTECASPLLSLDVQTRN